MPPWLRKLLGLDPEPASPISLTQRPDAASVNPNGRGDWESIMDMLNPREVPEALSREAARAALAIGGGALQAPEKTALVRKGTVGGKALAGVGQRLTDAAKRMERNNATTTPMGAVAKFAGRGAIDLGAAAAGGLPLLLAEQGLESLSAPEYSLSTSIANAVAPKSKIANKLTEHPVAAAAIDVFVPEALTNFKGTRAVARDAAKIGRKVVAEAPDIARGIGENVEAANAALARAGITPGLTTVDVTPRASEPLFGRDDVATLGDGTKVRFRYKVVEADDLVPSHDAVSFRPNRGAVDNTRDYTNKNTQGEVILESTRLDGDRMIRDTGTAEGPPIVAGNLVVAGNQRAMMQQRAARMHPKSFANVTNALRERAADFGIDPFTLDNFRNPVLVREIADESIDVADMGTLARLNRSSDVDPMKARDVASEAAARAKALSEAPRTQRWLSEAFESGDETLRSVLGDDAKGLGLLRNLVEDDVISRQEAARFVLGEGLSPEGKNMIESMLMASAVGDRDVLSFAQTSAASALGKLDTSLPALFNANSAPGYEIAADLQGALQLVRRMRDAKVKTPAELSKQADMFGQTPYTPMAEMLAGLIANKPKKVVRDVLAMYGRRAREFAGQLQTNDLFGFTPQTKDELFKTAYAAANDGQLPPALALADETATPVAAPRPTDGTMFDVRTGGRMNQPSTTIEETVRANVDQLAPGAAVPPTATAGGPTVPPAPPQSNALNKPRKPSYEERVFRDTAGDPNRARTPEEIEEASGFEFLQSSQGDYDAALSGYVKELDVELANSHKARQVLNATRRGEYAADENVAAIVQSGRLGLTAPQQQALADTVGALRTTFNDLSEAIDAARMNNDLQLAETLAAERQSVMSAASKLERHFALARSETGRALGSVRVPVSFMAASRYDAINWVRATLERQGILVDKEAVGKSVDEIFTRHPSKTGAIGGGGTGGDIPNELREAFDLWLKAKELEGKAKTPLEISQAARELADSRRKALAIINAAKKQTDKPLVVTEAQRKLAQERASAGRTIATATEQANAPITATKEQVKLAEERRSAQRNIADAEKQATDPVVLTEDQRLLAQERKDRLADVRAAKAEADRTPEVKDTEGVDMTDFSLRDAREEAERLLKELEQRRKGVTLGPTPGVTPERVKATSEKILRLSNLQKQDPKLLTPEQMEELQALRSWHRELRGTDPRNPIEDMSRMVDSEMATLDERIVKSKVPDAPPLTRDEKLAQAHAEGRVHDALAMESENSLAGILKDIRKAGREEVTDADIDEYFNKLKIGRTPKKAPNGPTRKERLDELIRKREADANFRKREIELVKLVQARQDKQHWLKAILGTRRADLLKNTATIAVNTFGGLAQSIETGFVIPAMAAGFDRVMAEVLDKPRTALGITRETTRGYFGGLFEGAKAGFSREQILHGINPLDPLDALNHYRTDMVRDLGVDNATSRLAKGYNTALKIYQTTNDLIFGTLNATDISFFRAELKRSNTERAILRFMREKGYKSLGKARKDSEFATAVNHYMDPLNQNPEDAFGAIVDALDATLRNQTKATDIARSLGGTPLGMYLMPYTTIPTNFAFQTLERVPVAGALSTKGYTRNELAQMKRKGLLTDEIAGRVEQRRFAETLAKQSLALSAMYVGIQMAREGRATGPYFKPTTPEERVLQAQHEMQNAKPMQFRTEKGDRWRSPVALGVTAVAAQLGASIWRESMSEVELSGKVAAGLTKGLAAGALQITQDIPFMQGVGRLQQLGQGDINVSRWLGREAASMLPFSGTVAQAGRILDRESQDRALPQGEGVETAIAAFKERTPLRDELPPARHVTGLQVPPPSVLEQIVDPTRPRRVIGGPTIDRLLSADMSYVRDLPERKDPNVLGQIEDAIAASDLQGALDIALPHIKSKPRRERIRKIVSGETGVIDQTARLQLAIEEAVEGLPPETMADFQARRATQGPWEARMTEAFLDNPTIGGNASTKDVLKAKPQSALQKLLTQQRKKAREFRAAQR